MIPVSSSNIAMIGWQPTTTPEALSGMGWVEFQNGLTGYYDGLPRDIFEAWRDSPSKGKFLHQNIKGNYPFVSAPLPQ